MPRATHHGPQRSRGLRVPFGSAYHKGAYDAVQCGGGATTDAKRWSITVERSVQSPAPANSPDLDGMPLRFGQGGRRPYANLWYRRPAVLPLPPPVTAKRDPTSPERFLIVEGRVWRVYESRLSEGAEPALVFSSGGQVRFCPRFPLGWYELMDDRLTDLYWDADF